MIYMYEYLYMQIIRNGPSDKDNYIALYWSMHWNTVRMNHEYSSSNFQKQWYTWILKHVINNNNNNKNNNNNDNL